MEFLSENGVFVQKWSFCPKMEFLSNLCSFEISKEHSLDKTSIFGQKLHFWTKTPFSDINS